MSSIRGGTHRGRGRGSHSDNATKSATPRGPASTHRGRGASNIRTRGTAMLRGAFAQTSRGNNAATSRGRALRGGPQQQRQQPAPAATAPAGARRRSEDGGGLKQREEQLHKRREDEKRDAIANRLMTDPTKAISLSDAITIVGTCQDMCSEYERVRRMLHNDVWEHEKDANGRPDETRMVKKFKRAAAGDPEQLPSDLRPPEVLRRTCDYLFDNLLATHPLAEVHHFIWDRTRSIRNDVSIQQFTKSDDLRVAIECFERIARFHIISLHQLALREKPYPEYDAQQDREQLDRTLLSLMEFYDDTRGRFYSQNEAEFKAYSVIFQLRNPIPDLDDRVQSWPRNIFDDPRVRTALEIYAAACSIKYSAGPDSSIPPVIARQDWESFWGMISSRRVSYLQACVSEVYFMLVREMVLSELVRSSKVGRIKGELQPLTDWTIDELWNLFNFDDEQELREFFHRWDLEFKQLLDGDQEYLDIRHVAGKRLPNGKGGPAQLKSSLVENKRHGRTLTAVINGLSVHQAKERGMVEEEEQRDEEMEEGMEDATEDEDLEKDQESVSDEDTLFVRELKPEKQDMQPDAEVRQHRNATAATSAFGKPSPSSFGRLPGSGGFGAPSQTSAFNPFAPKPAIDSQQSAVTGQKAPFNFLLPQDHAAQATTTSSPFTTATSGDNPKFSFSFLSKQSSAETSKSPEGSLNAVSPTDASQEHPTANDASAIGLLAPKKGRVVEKHGPWMVESSPTDTEKPNANGDAQPSKSAPAAATSSSQSQPETNLRSVQQQQTHFAPATTTSSSQSTQNAATTTAGSHSPTRRPSGFQDTKPKKPSPLAHSITANEESAPLAGPQQQTSRAVEQPPVQDLFSNKQSAHPKPTDRETKPEITPSLSTPVPSFDTVTTKLADEVFLCPRNGILKQYLEHHLKYAVAEAQEKVLEERIQARLAKLREITIRRKWYQAWLRNASKCKARRRRREQKERRERTRTGGDSEWVPLISPRKSKPPTRDLSPIKKRQMVDTLFNTLEQEKSEMDLVRESQGTAGSKRAASTNGSDRLRYGQGHKRFKSMDQAVGHGRSSTSSMSDSNTDILKRSSFLGFSLAPDAPNRASTTRSTYFRMKALGLTDTRPRAATSQLRGTKRPRSESLDSDDAASSASRPRSFSALGSTSEPSRDIGLMGPPSARSTRSKTIDDDDALFARLRAAREALKDGETFMKEETAKEEKLRRSMSRSLSSNESPSMARARAEAGLRASQAGSDFAASTGRNDVPAYRHRQSRFLSREEQARAVERARETRALRNSQGLSRPESRSELQQPADPSTTTTTLRDQPPEVQGSPRKQNFSTLWNGRGVNGTNGVSSKRPPSAHTSEGLMSHNQAESSHSFDRLSEFGNTAPAVQQPQQPMMLRNPFSQSSSFAPPVSNLNPFLQGTSASHRQQLSSTVPAYQPPPDHTVAPAQINNALSQSFGLQLAAPTPSGHATCQGSATPAQPNSYLQPRAASEAISLVSDDEGDASGGPYGQAEYFADFGGTMTTVDRSATQSFTYETEAELLQNAHNYANANSFAALANQPDNYDGANEDGVQLCNQDDPDEDPEEDYDDEEDVPDEYDHSDRYSAEDDDQPEHTPNGHHYDDEEEVDADEEDHGDSYDDDLDDDSDGHSHFASMNDAYNRHVHAVQPAKNQALQEVGGTEEEAIELSD